MLSGEKHIASALILKLLCYNADSEDSSQLQGEHNIITLLIESIDTQEATSTSASRGLLKMERVTSAKSYTSCTQTSILCRTRGSAERQGLNTEDKSFCEHKPLFRSEKAEANTPPTSLGYASESLAGTCLNILICTCMDCVLESSPQDLNEQLPRITACQVCISISELGQKSIRRNVFLTSRPAK